MRASRCGALIHDIRDGCSGKSVPIGRSRSRRVAGNRVIGGCAPIYSSDSLAIILCCCSRAREGVCEPRAVGFGNAIWSLPGNDTNAVGDPWTGCLLGRHPEKFRFILLALSLRSAVAAGACDPCVHCAFFLSSRRSWWRKELVLVWRRRWSVIGLLMWGGIPELPFGFPGSLGGLPVTLILATFGLAFGSRSGSSSRSPRSKLPAIRRYACSMSN